MTRTTIRRWLLAAFFTAAGMTGLAAYDAATNTARADDKPAAERTDGRRPVRTLLDAVGDTLPVKVELPTPAAPTTAPEPTVEPTTPAPEPVPTTPAAPDPDPEPEPEPSEPARGGDSTPSPEPTPTAPPLCDVPLVDGVCQILDDVTDVIPPVVVDVPPIVVPPIVVDVPPVVVDVPPITVTLPADGPSTLPGADAPAAQPAPVTAPAAPVAVVPALPVPVGPTVVETLDEPEPTLIELAAEAIDAADPEPDCWRPPGRDRADRQIHDGLNPPPPRKKAKRGHGGCPGTPGAPDRTEVTPAAAGSAGSGGQQAPADLTGPLTPPALDRLDHTRPRSHLPPSRHTAVEPGPA